MTYYKTYNIYDLRHAPRVTKRTLTSDKTAAEVLRACLPKSAPVSIEQDGEKAVARLWGCVRPVMIVRPDSTAERVSREEARRAAIIRIIKKAIGANSGKLCPDDGGIFMDCNDIDHAAEEAADEIIKRGL